jgi:hypothetical protein
MARAQSQYLRLFDAAGVTYQRWQSYYSGSNVTYDNASWFYVPFSCDGISSGIVSGEANISIAATATALVVSAFQQAITAGWLCTVSFYEFDTEAGNEAPQATQTLLAAVTGQVVGGAADLTTITIQLGSALAPVGAQVPPRTATTQLIGVGCML